jgi:hypothetical protein
MLKLPSDIVPLKWTVKLSPSKVKKIKETMQCPPEKHTVMNSNERQETVGNRTGIRTAAWVNPQMAAALSD